MDTEVSPVSAPRPVRPTLQTRRRRPNLQSAPSLFTPRRPRQGPGGSTRSLRVPSPHSPRPLCAPARTNAGRAGPDRRRRLARGGRERLRRDDLRVPRERVQQAGEEALNFPVSVASCISRGKVRDRSRPNEIPAPVACVCAPRSVPRSLSTIHEPQVKTYS